MVLLSTTVTKYTESRIKYVFFNGFDLTKSHFYHKIQIKLYPLINLVYRNRDRTYLDSFNLDNTNQDSGILDTHVSV